MRVANRIDIVDDLTIADADSDGDGDGPFANGDNRYGIRVVGPGAFTGNVTVQNTSIMSVEGNNSALLSVETGVTGNIVFNAAAAGVLGNNSFGVRIAAPVAGAVKVGGGLSVLGENSVGFSLTGDVTGRVTLDGQLTATGFRSTQRPGQTAMDRLDADDKLLGGVAARIAGNVGGGLFFDKAQPNTNNDVNDEDGDGVLDSDETTAEIISYGSAPALQIGSTIQTVTLGVPGSTPTGRWTRPSIPT